MKTVAIRLAAVSAVLALGSVSAHADLTIPFSSFNGNSVQTFTAEDLAAFDLVKLTVVGKGNTYVAKAGTPGETNGTVTPVAFGFPITKIVVGSKLNIASGSAVGSALYFHRDDDDTGGSYGFTLANFTINYVTKQVLADVTPDGGKVQIQAPLYNFNVATPLALKYKFPLSVTGHEVLDQLKLTDGIKEVFNGVLQLPEYATDALDYDYGTLVQDIAVSLRKNKISTTPYVAQ